MINTVEVPNKRRQKVKPGLICGIALGLVFAIILSIFICVHVMDLNGKLYAHNVTIKKVSDQETSLITENDKLFSLDKLDNSGISWKDYIGKDVILIVTAQQFGSIPYVLGLIDNGKTIIDYNITLSRERAENIIFIVSLALLMSLSFACSGYIFRFIRKTKKTEIVSVDDYAWRTCAHKQPMTPKRKTYSKCILVFIFLILFATGIVQRVSENHPIESETVIVWGLFIGAVLFITLFSTLSVIKVFPKDEIKFYSYNFPFNFDDVSHLPLKKNEKAQLQHQLRANRANNPDGFFDYGNGFKTVFTSEGLYLHEEDFIADMEKRTQGVFEDFDNEEIANRALDTLIPYSELNLIALPKYRKYDHMFGVVIKSRLDETKINTQSIQYDIHYVLDSNLLRTLKKFNVKVQDLEYILNNKEKLMRINCPKSKDNFLIENVNQKNKKK